MEDNAMMVNELSNRQREGETQSNLNGLISDRGTAVVIGGLTVSEKG